MEPLGQNMQQEAPDELVWLERHRAKPRLAFAAVIFLAERHTALVEADQPAVRDGGAGCITGEISEHPPGPRKRRVGVEETFLFLGRGEGGRKRPPSGPAKGGLA